VRAEPDDVVVTLGFLHSIDLICRTLARQGVRRLAVENPSITEQVEIARAHGLDVRPVPVDDAGIVVDALGEAQAVIVTPAHQFPLGVVLSPARRRALAAWARQRDALIIENDYDAEFRYDGPPVGAVQAIAPERTVFVGTTSKTLAPAARLGWIVAPPALGELPIHGGGGFSGLNAHVLARLLSTSRYERHVQRCRREYRRRRDALVRALPRFRPLGIAGGLHLTLRLEAGTDADGLADALRARGIEIQSLSRYAHAPTAYEPALVIGYGQLPLPSIPRIVDALLLLGGA
jgi:GntR family transcriptional regulator / MocR family aminotransferase